MGRNMRIKDSIRIAGKDFSITEVNGLGDFGVTEFNENRILLKGGMNEDNKLSTLCHECVEILNETYDLNLPHQTIQTLEAGIFQIIKDNLLDK